VCYDITDDKIRSRAVKILEDYGERVQYSVFEFNLNPAKILEMKHKLLKKKLIDRKWVSFTIYPLCENCYNKTERFGDSRILDEKTIVF
jgi:CRISPR-associated protein Cas2